jgi:gliding motility-associated-like protein
MKYILNLILIILAIETFGQPLCVSKASSPAHADIVFFAVGSTGGITTCATPFISNVYNGTGIANQYSNFKGYVPSPNWTYLNIPMFGYSNGGPGYVMQCDIDACDAIGLTKNYGLKVYFDWNHNGVFTDTSEQVFVGPLNPSGVLPPFTFTGLVFVPPFALTGLTSVRAVLQELDSITNPNDIQSCGIYGYGETEDYDHFIIVSKTCDEEDSIVAGNITYVDNSCAADSVVLKTVGSTSSLFLSYQWQISTDSINYTDILNANDTTYTIPPNTAGAYYQMIIVCPNTGLADSTAPVWVSTHANTSNVIVNQSICNGQSYYGYTTSGTYIDTFINASGCDSIHKVILSVFPINKDTILKSICQGQNFLGYNTSGVFIDTFINANLCDSIRTILLTVNANPQVAISTSTTVVCDGSTATLTASSASAYTWQPGNTNSMTLAIQPIINTIYTLTVSNNFGCTASTTQLITTGITPAIIPSAAQYTICQGGSTQLNVQGGNTYTWTPNFNLTNTTSNNPIASPTNGVNYTVTVSDNGNCPTTTSIFISVIDTTLKIINDTICQGSFYVFGNQQISSSGTYSKVFLNAIGCDSAVQLNLVVNPLPNPAINMATDACVGDTIVASILQPNNNVNYNWLASGVNVFNTTSTSINFTCINTGNQNINVIASLGNCSATSNTKIDIHKADVAINSISAPNLCIGDTFKLTINPKNNYSYLWEPLNVSGFAYTSKIDTNKIITVYAEDEFGCKAVDSILIKAFFCCDVIVPNIFTPNGDFLNDDFGFIYNGAITLKKFSIYNRYGQEVFNTTNDKIKWLGIQNGQPVENGNYFYYIEYLCKNNVLKILKGSFILEK